MNTVQVRHFQIEQQDVWLQLLHKTHCFHAITGFADHTNVGVFFQDPADDAAYQGVVIGKEDMNCIHYFHIYKISIVRSSDTLFFILALKWTNNTGFA